MLGETVSDALRERERESYDRQKMSVYLGQLDVFFRAIRDASFFFGVQRFRSKALHDHSHTFNPSSILP